MTRNILGPLFVIGAALALMLLTLVGMSVQSRADDACQQTLAQAEAQFANPGDAFAVGPVEDAAGIVRFVTALGGPPSVAADHAARAVMIVIGRSANFPPGAVSLGFFDERGCALGGVNGVPLRVVASLLGSQTPVPKPVGQGV